MNQGTAERLTAMDKGQGAERLQNAVDAACRESLPGVSTCEIRSSTVPADEVDPSIDTVSARRLCDFLRRLDV